MARVIKGMRGWLAHSKTGEDEWEAARKAYLEEQVRRLFEVQEGGLGRAIEEPDRELGSVSVPVRSGAFRPSRNVSGKVFLSKDLYEDGERYRVHLMVSAASEDEAHEAWRPLCAWTFDSASEVADFVAPPSAEPAS